MNNNSTTKFARGATGIIFLVLAGGCCNIFKLNPEIGKAVTNVKELNSAMAGTTSLHEQQAPSASRPATGSNQVGLIENLKTVSKTVTDVTGTMLPMESALRQVDGALNNLSTPMTDLKSRVNDIRSELTHLQTNLVQLRSGLGTLHGQIVGDSRDAGTNPMGRGLVGGLQVTREALQSNTLAISQVNDALTNNNRLLGESTKALKGIESLKGVLPLLASMLTLMGTLWVAVNLGNTARKSACDKLKEKNPNMITSGIAAYRTGGLSAAGRDIGSAILSVQDFRDAYAYAAFQLVVASIIIPAFFGNDIVKVEWLTTALISLLTIGFLSLLVLYHGDKRDVKLMFNGEWPLNDGCMCVYWVCPLLFGLVKLCCGK